jgi:hypothetical protein
MESPPCVSDLGMGGTVIWENPNYTGARHNYELQISRLPAGAPEEVVTNAFSA